MKKIFLKILSVFSFMCMFMFNFSVIKGLQNNNNTTVSDNPIHVFYCADDGNAMPTGVSITSLLSNSGNDKINIHIVSFKDNKMSDENVNKISSLKKIKDFDLDFVYFDKSKLDEFNTDQWNKAIMIKLYAAELFPDLDRIIWLDDDTIILKSLKELYNRKDLEDNYLAAVDVSNMYNEYAKKNKLTYRQKIFRWLTAGIGLYNLKGIRKDDIMEKLLESAKEYNTKSYEFKIRNHCGGIEEYALTSGFSKDRVLILPWEYSVMTFVYQKGQGTKIPNDCVMLHFAGPKPWNKDKRINKQLLKIWNNYYSIYNKYTNI